jgi:hypothetical protein
MFTPHTSRWQTSKYDCKEELDDVLLVMALLANLSAPILDIHLSFCTDGQDGDVFEIFEGGAPKLLNVSILL